MAKIAAFVREERKDREAYINNAATRDSRATSAYANMVHINLPRREILDPAIPVTSHLASIYSRFVVEDP